MRRVRSRHLRGHSGAHDGRESVACSVRAPLQFAYMWFADGFGFVPSKDCDGRGLDKLSRPAPGTGNSPGRWSGMGLRLVRSSDAVVAGAIWDSHVLHAWTRLGGLVTSSARPARITQARAWLAFLGRHPFGPWWAAAGRSWGWALSGRPTRKNTSRPKRTATAPHCLGRLGSPLKSFAGRGCGEFSLS